MSYAVLFAPEAGDQLEELFLHVADQASVATADTFVGAIIGTCERLSRFPHRGVPRDDIRPGLRVTHHRGRTIIAYTVEDASRQVWILGVYHGGQDYEAVFDFPG